MVFNVKHHVYLWFSVDVKHHVYLWFSADVWMLSTMFTYGFQQMFGC